MADLPSISIITPTLNQGNFIAQTIESVLAQKYPALEYLVIDGGSTDQTLAVIRKYERQLTWISEADSGQSAAINKGWQRASGEILAWLNSDDLLRPEALQTIAKIFQASPETVMVYGGADFIDATGEILGPYPTGNWNYADYLKNITNFLPQPSVFIRREAVIRAGWLDESLHYLMDYDLFLRVGLQGKVQQSPATLSAMRLHVDAKSLSALKGFGAEMVAVIERTFESGKLPQELLAYRAEAMRKACLYAASTAYWGGDAKQARAWLTQCWQQTSWSQIPGSLIRLSLLSALGLPGLKWAERWPGNPFTRTLVARKEPRATP